MIVSAIVAVADNGVIGRDSDLPWHLPDDMKFFQRTTRGHHIITGRKNYETIPLKYRPLNDRVNIIVTRNEKYKADGAVVVHSLKAALDLAERSGEVEVFIIGGGQIYSEALKNDLVDKLYITEVHAEIEGDTRFPWIDVGNWQETDRKLHRHDERHEFDFSFVVLERIG
ncbi:MAG: dihydrofolate reductase [Flavobacteriales bacterium]|nr:dihydrofolate reductase [Flavobacteriales bacterium]